MTPQEGNARRAIEAALLEFQQAPARHIVALRQPALLFASIREVLQIAGERSADDDGPPPSPPVVQAARFFIRNALLSPTATHYGLLGLAPAADAAVIKDRYRLMMRLMHPDFAADTRTWPADAAARINQAYEVLSSPDRRQAYDVDLSAAAMAPPGPSPGSREVARQREQKREEPAAAPRDPRLVLRWLATAFGAAGGLVLFGSWLAGSQDRETLVQRAATRSAQLRAPSSPMPSIFDIAPAAPAAPALTPAPAAENTLTAALARALPALLRPAEPAAPVASPEKNERAGTITTALAAAVPAAVAGAAPAAEQARAEPVPPAPPPPQVPAPAPAVTMPPPVVAQVAPAPPPAPAPRAMGPSVADVQPQLMRLLQQIESGWGDNVISELAERNARGAAGAQALARQIDTSLDGMRPVRVTRSDFKGEPREGRLVLVGNVVVQLRDGSTRMLALTAEFAERSGAPSLVRLAPGT